MSTTESDRVKDSLSQASVLYAAGAGYKQLCVIDGLIDTYILTRGSTFNWDTCAPHAMLRSLGGGVVDFKKTVAAPECDLQLSQLTYNQPDVQYDGIDQWCNMGGLVAYISEEKCREVLSMLKNAEVV